MTETNASTNPSPTLASAAAVVPPAPPPPAEAESAEDKFKNISDLIFGVTLAVVAATLALNDLGGGKYGGDEILAANDKATAYAWYNAKGVKQTLIEGQADLMDSLVEAKAFTPVAEEGVKKQVAKMRKKVAKYDREKTEILQGSAKVGEANWAQEVPDDTGKMVKGKVIGAEEYAAKANALGPIGDLFDNGTLFLQMSLVLGAIGIVIAANRLKIVCYCAMISLWGFGSYYCYLAWMAALPIK